MAGRINIHIATALVMMVTMPILLEAAARYTVPWKLGKGGVGDWAKNTSRKFFGGDFLDFQYKNTKSNLAIVNNDEYKNCKAGPKVTPRTTGHDQIKLSGPNVYLFISTKNKTECDQGLKLQIKVA